MDVDIATYRARIGLHNLKCGCAMRTHRTMMSRTGRGIDYVTKLACFLLPVLITILLLRSGNVELNPGPINRGISSVNLAINKELFNKNHKQLIDLQTVKGLKIAHLNIRSLYHKCDFVKLMLEHESIDILGLSESWLHPDIEDSELNIPGYHKIIRNDRTTDKAGGVAVYCKKNTKHIYRKEWNISHVDIETVWVVIRMPQTRPLFICTVYRPENSLTSALDILEEQVGRAAESHSNPEIIIMGDMNVDYLTRNYEYRHLKSFEQLFQVKQIINKPTRVTDKSSTCIDHMYTNREEMVYQTDVVPLGLSDHSLTYIIRKGKKNKVKSSFIKARTYRNFNEVSFNNDLAHADWSGVFSADTIDGAWSAFKRTFLQISDKHAPFVNMKVREDSPPFINENLRSLCVDRDYFMRKAHKTRKLEDFNRAKQLRNQANNLLDLLRKRYFDDQIRQNRGNSKGLWKTLKKLLPSKGDRNIIQEIKSGDRTICDSKEIANVINRFFANIGNTLAANITPPTDFVPPEIVPTENPFTMQLIDTEFVKKELGSMDINKSTGMDGIPSRLLKAGSSEICRALTHIFNRTVVTGTIPSEWKTARVTPIFKDGDKSDAGNYRPISILPVVMKILERAIHNQVYGFLTENNILTPVQSGFRKLYSTLTTLIDVSDNIHNDVEEGRGTGMLFLDLKKAFDTVNHDLLIQKLRQYGFGNSSLAWFTNYLSNRQQAVEINGTRSDWENVKTGVPQGSILGPLLFILYINDLPRVIEKCNVTLYADDTALYFSSNDPGQIKQCLEEDLSRLKKWFDYNKLTLNVRKTKFMQFSSGQKKNKFSDVQVKINEEQVERVEIFKYLGLWLDETLNFKEHVCQISKKVNKRLGLLLRIRKNITKDTALMLYKSLILPHLEYCDVVWDTCSNQLKDSLQKLQNRACKIILKRNRYAHTNEIHQTLKLLKLSDRRRFHTACMAYRCANNLVPEYLRNIYQQVSDVHQHGTRNAVNNNIFIVQNSSESGKGMFKHRSAILLNSLPAHLKNSPSLITFKRAYIAYTQPP
jgi:hypothetical protein